MAGAAASSATHTDNIVESKHLSADIICYLLSVNTVNVYKHTHFAARSQLWLSLEYS